MKHILSLDATIVKRNFRGRRPQWRTARGRS